MLGCDFGSPNPAPATPHSTSSTSQRVAPPLTLAPATPASIEVLAPAICVQVHSRVLVLETASALAFASHLQAIAAGWHSLPSAQIVTVPSPTLNFSTVGWSELLAEASFESGPSLSSSPHTSAFAQPTPTPPSTTNPLSFAS